MGVIDQLIARGPHLARFGETNTLRFECLVLCGKVMSGNVW